jgi:hypothetical protein
VSAAEITLQVGDRVRFAEERGPYTVKALAANGRYAICTKPFNPQRTVLYTIVDSQRQVRGTDNWHGLGYETAEEIADAAAMFDSGEAEVGRDRIWLCIVEVIPAKAPGDPS